MRQDAQQDEKGAARSFCLTELSITALVAGALGVSALLWLAIGIAL
ncbi:MAG: hypothetical protein AAGA21_21305 [Pseudomonadota bacterium]